MNLTELTVPRDRVRSIGIIRAMSSTVPDTRRNAVAMAVSTTVNAGDQTPTTTRQRLARVTFTGRLLTLSRTRAQVIIKAHGGQVTEKVSKRTTMLVVGQGGWPILADGSASRNLVQAESLQDSGYPIEIVSEAAFLQAAGIEPKASGARKNYKFEQVCELIGVTSVVLRRWEALGLIESADGHYDFQDIVALRTISALINRGIRPHVIARNVRSLARCFGNVDRPLAQLKLVSESGELMAEVGDALLSPDGQFMLNFNATAGTAQGGLPLQLNPVEETPGRTAEEWFDHAVLLEEQGRYGESIDAYRRALGGQPHFPEAHFNLGNVLRAMERNEAAEEHFLMAVAQHPDLSTAWYNLADVQEEFGRFDEAIKSLTSAIDVDPTFADAHYNLASCFAAVGQQLEAAHHWQAYLRLDPDSPWAEQARQQLRNLRPE